MANIRRITITKEDDEIVRKAERILSNIIDGFAYDGEDYDEVIVVNENGKKSSLLNNGEFYGSIYSKSMELASLFDYEF